MSDVPSKIKSADDLIIKEEARILGKEIPAELPQDNKTPEAAPEDISADEGSQPEETGEQQGKPEAEKTSQEASSDENVDPYGNEVAAEKTYTEAEVQQMIRRRLKERHTPTADQPVKDEAKPAEGEDWRNELREVIKEEIVDIGQKARYEEDMRREEQTQMDFQEKFVNGSRKYGDFESVVSGKPVTLEMMKATRSMEDPAAFLYAACKNNPAELERISKIADPYAQVAEIGRLEEKMRKARAVTKAPVPPKRINGDMSDETPKRDIDSLINSHAKSKIHDRRK